MAIPFVKAALVAVAVGVLLSAGVLATVATDRVTSLSAAEIR